MGDLTRLPHALDPAQKTCQAIIETPKGKRNKFDYDPESGLFSLARLLPEGFSFPYDFGFIPSTRAEDGDPLDIMVMMDEPVHVGCLLKIRLIGVIEAVETEEGQQNANDRLIGVALQSYLYQDIQEISQIHHSVIEQVSEFFKLYNKNSKKQMEITSIEGSGRALKLLENAITVHQSDGH
jgi:inorganic pyrophosphatase